jgi:hypothetical protein
MNLHWAIRCWMEVSFIGSIWYLCWLTHVLRTESWENVFNRLIGGINRLQRHLNLSVNDFRWNQFDALHLLLVVIVYRLVEWVILPRLNKFTVKLRLIRIELWRVPSILLLLLLRVAFHLSSIWWYSILWLNSLGVKWNWIARFINAIPDNSWFNLWKLGNHRYLTRWLTVKIMTMSLLLCRPCSLYTLILINVCPISKLVD